MSALTAEQRALLTDEKLIGDLDDAAYAALITRERELDRQLDAELAWKTEAAETLRSLRTVTDAAIALHEQNQIECPWSGDPPCGDCSACRFERAVQEHLDREKDQ